MRFRKLFTFIILCGSFPAYLFAQLPHNSSFEDLDKAIREQHLLHNWGAQRVLIQQALDKAEADWAQEDSICLHYKLKLAEANIYLSEPYDEVLEACEQIIEIEQSKRNNWTGNRINAVLIKAKALGFLDRKEERKSYYISVLDELKESLGENHLYYAELLWALGMHYQSSKQFEKAEQLFLEALEIYQQQKKGTVLLAEKMSHLGMTYSLSMRQTDKGFPYMQEAKAIILKAKGPKSLDYASLLSLLGPLNINLGNLEKAEELLKEAIRLYKAKGAWSAWSSDSHNLAFVYKKQGRLAEAERLYLYILEQDLRSESPYSSSMRALYDVLTSVYFQKEDLATAEAYAYRALSTQIGAAIERPVDWKRFSEKPLYDRLTTIKTMENIQFLLDVRCAQLKEEAEQNRLRDTIISMAESASQLVDQMRASFLSKRDKLNSLYFLDKMIRRAIGTAYDWKSQGAYRRALVLSDYNKSLLLTESFQREELQGLLNLPDEIRQREAALMEQIDRAKTQLNMVAAKERPALLKKTNALRLEQEQFQSELKSTYPEYFDLQYSSKQLDVDRLQEKLSDSTALLAYYQAKRGIYLFTLTNEKVYITALKLPEKQLEAKVDSFRLLLTGYNALVVNPTQHWKATIDRGHWLYNEVLKPGLDSLSGIKELIIVPDKSLCHIPFEVLAFTDTLVDQRAFVLNRYAIGYSYAAMLWGEDYAVQKDHNGQLLGIAASYALEEKDSSFLQLNRSADLRELRYRLQPLPAAQEEVKLLEKNFDGAFLYGKGASEANFKQQAADYGVIHLAMHGLLDKTLPSQSALAFTELRDSTEDNFLKAEEIAGLNLAAELVVLSACETGYGRFESGEGVMSLGRSFMYAGVPSLVLSLWQVSDASTAKIMQLFYEGLYEGLSKTKALQRAKQLYLKDANLTAAHPAFWGPFIVVGNQEPIVLGDSGGLAWPIWLGVGAVALLLLLFLWRSKRQA